MFHKGDGLEIPKGQQKWIDELNINVELDWKFLYTLSKKCNLMQEVCISNSRFYIELWSPITNYINLTSKKTNYVNIVVK